MTLWPREAPKKTNAGACRLRLIWFLATAVMHRGLVCNHYDNPNGSRCNSSRGYSHNAFLVAPHKLKWSWFMKNYGSKCVLGLWPDANDFRFCLCAVCSIRSITIILRILSNLCFRTVRMEFYTWFWINCKCNGAETARSMTYLKRILPTFNRWRIFSHFWNTIFCIRHIFTHLKAECIVLCFYQHKRMIRSCHYSLHYIFCVSFTFSPPPTPLSRSTYYS